MAGHSKWANIKHRKGAQDAKRAKMFSRISKEITIAVKEGGEDIESNPRLRLAIQNAKGVNMPKDNIERAISRATTDEATLEEATFEGYSPGGVAIFVECLTDNNNRTVSSIRAIFNKYNGSLGKNGSLSFIFDTKGVFTIKRKDDMDMDEFELEVIDAGAEDIDMDDDLITITTAKEDFGNMQKKLDEMGIEAENAGLQRLPNNTKELGVDDAMKVLKMIEVFEDDDDVQNVYHNLELTEDIEKAMQ